MIGTPKIGAQAEPSTGSPIAVALPAGTAVGDFLVLFGTENSALVLNTTPPGWVEQFNVFTQLSGAPAAASLFMATRIADGTEGATVSVAGPSNKGIFQILAFPGVDQSTPLDVPVAYDNPDTAGNSSDLPNVTVATNGSAIVYAGTISGGSATATPPAGFTETMDMTVANRPGTGGYLLGAPVGPIGTRTIQYSGAGRRACGVLVLRPAGGVTPPVGTVWKRWNGTAWQDVTLRRWDGTTWVT